MSVEEVRIGIIGGGLMGREIAAAFERWPALVGHPVRPRLVGVCDINPDALNWFKQIDSVKSFYTSHVDLLADPTIDVVYIAVRHDLHEAMYIDAIRAGKDLLAEKPFGIDGAAANAILDAINEHPGVFVRCSSEMPFFPGAQAAISYVTSGAAGRIVEAKSSFAHSSDLDRSKPLNWKRQSQYCGAAGVMNDLGMHVWHVPLRLGWMPETVFAVLQNIVTERPGPTGELEPCDTWDNATIHSWIGPEADGFPLTTEMKRISPGQKNTWAIEVLGMDGGVRFSTKRPKTVEIFQLTDVPGVGVEQSWVSIDAGSQSAWPTVTGAIFETGFSDSILQMWAVFLAERARELNGRFACVSPQEAASTHAIFEAAARSHTERAAVRLRSNTR